MGDIRSGWQSRNKHTNAPSRPPNPHELCMALHWIQLMCAGHWVWLHDLLLCARFPPCKSCNTCHMLHYWRQSEISHVWRCCDIQRNKSLRDIVNAVQIIEAIHHGADDASDLIKTTTSTIRSNRNMIFCEIKMRDTHTHTEGERQFRG